MIVIRLIVDVDASYRVEDSDMQDLAAEILDNIFSGVNR